MLADDGHVVEALLGHDVVDEGQRHRGRDDQGRDLDLGREVDLLGVLAVLGEQLAQAFVCLVYVCARVRERGRDMTKALGSV